MKRIALLSAAALVGAGTLATSAAEARGGGAVAAGIIGGLAAGALIGAAAQAHAAPAYGYGGPGYGVPAYGPAPVVYRPAPAYRAYEVDGPVYETRRVVTYERAPVYYGPVRGWHGGWHGGWDGGYGYRGW